MSRFKWLFMIFLRYYRHLGLRVSSYALLALFVAFISPGVEGFLNDKTKSVLDFGSVMPVLTIMASSMLAVSTFSLNVMVSAHRAAAESTTPRVHRLLLENTTTQSVLATFIGAFVFALISIILYQAKFYSDGAAVVVMGVTIAVFALVVFSILRWIQHLTDLGSVDGSLKTVTERAKTVLVDFAQTPALGGRFMPANGVPDRSDLTPVTAKTSGYMQLVDVMAVDECLPEEAALYILRQPGTHVLKGQVIAQCTHPLSDETADKIRDKFVFGPQRSFEQDAEFGLVVLAEIASKALSPGINDAGTAIAAIQNLKMLLWNYFQKMSRDTPDDAPRVFLTVPGPRELLHAAYALIARDGASHIEVAQTLRRALSDLSEIDDPDVRQTCGEIAELGMEYAERAGVLPREKRMLEQVSLHTD